MCYCHVTSFVCECSFLLTLSERCLREDDYGPKVLQQLCGLLLSKIEVSRPSTFELEDVVSFRVGVDLCFHVFIITQSR